jgi:hypothetical protein
LPSTSRLELLADEAGVTSGELRDWLRAEVSGAVERRGCDVSKTVCKG